MTSGSGERLRLSAVCETDCFPLLRASVQHEVKHSDPGDSVEVWAEGSPRCVPVDEFMGILPNAVSRHVSGAHFSYLPSALNSPCRAECLSEAEVGFLQSEMTHYSFISCLQKICDLNLAVHSVTFYMNLTFVTVVIPAAAGFIIAQL